MIDPDKMPVHEQWTCGHVATAMCSECYQERVRKANHLEAENERLRARYDSAANQAVRYADEIERLRALNYAGDMTLRQASAEIERLHVENTRLRAEIELVSK